MTNLMKSDSAYANLIADLKSRYRASQIKASVAVNTEMLAFYWSLGRDIVSKDAENAYGSGFYATLSNDLCKAIPNARCFSPTNLRYMRRFYLLFREKASLASGSGTEILPQVGEEFEGLPGLQNLPQVGADLLSIPWGHIKLLIDKCKGDRDKALFYVHKTMENGWSRAILAHQVEAGLYERQGKAVTNFSRLLPVPQSDLAQEVTKDPYQFDFLAIREDYDEFELKNALLDNIQRFLLELGTGFAFLGREYRVMVGTKEKFIDMLFYHTRLHCYVVLEVKARAFDSSDMGQLGTYVVAVNHLLKSEIDAPTIGLLVCKGLDKVEAQYALEASSQPIGISGYELSKLIPEEFKGSLPTIEEIESELEGYHAK